MTLRELLIYLLSEESEELLDKKLSYCEKENPDGTFDGYTINVFGISENYLLFSHKCPQCEQ